MNKAPDILLRIWVIPIPMLSHLRYREKYELHKTVEPPDILMQDVLINHEEERKTKGGEGIKVSPT